MMTRRVLIGNAAGLLLADELLAAQPAPVVRGWCSARRARSHDEGLVREWSRSVVRAGQSSPPHRHPGITIAYVLEGEIRSKVGDEPEKTYKVGEMFIETPNQLHGVSRNASDTKPAKLLAVMLSEKGKPRTTPEK